MTAPLLVFDLDGTLADTNRDLIPVLNRTTATVGLAPVDIADVGHVVGSGARSMLMRAFELQNIPLPDQQLDGLFELFIADYEANIAQNTVLFEGVVEAMNRLESEGWSFAVCTNKMERLAVRLLSELGVQNRFRAVTGGDTFAVRKPDPGHLLKTIEMSRGDRSKSVMVGDSKTDIHTANAAGIPVIAVDFGYSDRPIAEYSPDRIISAFSQLPDTAKELLG